MVDRPTIEHLVERIVAPLGLRADRTAPLVDARLADGSRVNVALPPLAVDGPYLTIRRFRTRRITLGEACPLGVDAPARRAVSGRANLVVAGGSGAGKTTLLNALAGRSRRAADRHGRGRGRTGPARGPRGPPGGPARQRRAVRRGTIRDLVRNALRMRPDRLVVGEVRGAESLDLVQAMNTGHAGSMATCHANSPTDALDRLATLALMADVALPLAAVAAQYRSAVDLVVQVARHPSGRRGVVAVWEVPLPGADTAGRLLADDTGVLAPPTRPPRWLPEVDA